MQHFTTFTDYEACVQYLVYDIHKIAPNILNDEAVFQKSEHILAILGKPQNTTPTIHIAATSGKGSIAYAIDAILRAHLFRTTLMVSPHAYDIRERIQINGRLISKQLFLSIANEFFESMTIHNIMPTFFEARMSMGFMAAAKQKGDYVVAETGLGGLWDTSNTITHADKLAVIGSIGLDHTHILGTTVEKIAAQKAGIMPQNGQAIVLTQSDAINTVFKAIAKKRNTKLHWVEPAATEYETNWKMAKATTRLIAQRDNWPYNDTKADKAIQSLRIPARFEVRTINNQTIVLDAAHNPQKAKALASWLLQKFPGKSFITLLAISDGKDVADIIKRLNPITQHYVVTSFLSNQHDLPVHAIPADQLASIVLQHSRGIPMTVFHDAKEALGYTEKNQVTSVLITGSFYLVGELGNLLTSHETQDA